MGPALLPGFALELEKFVFNFEFLPLQRRYHEVVGQAILSLGLNLPVQFLMAPFQRCDMAFSRHEKLLSASWTPPSSQIFHALSTPFRAAMEIRCKTRRDRLTKGMIVG